MTSNSFIHIKGAREHNLKNIDIDIPRDKLVVITGVSGSGKSSLAFDTIYAEGQRRYVESLSSYARQFLGMMEKPDVDLIDGLSPAISIEQKATNRNPRSTVGTVTEIYDYLRLLYARVGDPHCHKCGEKVSAFTIDQIVDRVYGLGVGTRLQIIAPLIQNQKGIFKDLIEKMIKEGFGRMRIDNEIYELHEDEIKNLKLDKNKKHTLELVVDRIIIKEESRSRITDSLEIALKYGNGIVCLFDSEKNHYYTQNLYCNKCDISLPELSPRAFSFNSPSGACQSCDGLGVHTEFDEHKIIPDTDKSLIDGAITLWGGAGGYWYMQTYKDLEYHFKVNIDKPWKKLSTKEKKIVLYGGETKGAGAKHFSWGGVINNLKRRYKDSTSDEVRANLSSYMHENICGDCKGLRLRPESLGVKFHSKNIIEICRMSVESLAKWFENIKVTKQQIEIVSQVLKEIQLRIKFLNDVGVGYLSLERKAASLSGGEAQRIRLATQIGSALMGVLYVLDEPSIGLHQKDNDRLLQTLKNMRDLGNTVIVVEHDEDTILLADHIIDLGPKAGVHGGEVVAEGTAEEIKKNPKSLTGAYLSGKKFIPIKKIRREGNGKSLTIVGAKENNLKNLNVDFPLGMLVCVTGVSGSGKSTLVNDILYNFLANKINKQTSVTFGKHESIEGIKNIDRVVLIDQEPIGRTPRSNPATYTGIFTPIRELFSNLPEAQLRGYSPGRFSFNVKGGRCENCEGAGIIKIEMHFLPDVYVTCDVCKGKRFNKETLEVQFKGKSIFDILNMTIESALSFFENIEVIKRKLQTMCDVGLDYIKLGQAATTLSGGEAQRIKLSSELSRKNTDANLYILDEPTTGLHFEDIAHLLKVLHSLVDRGNSMIIIEHNLDVVKTADYIIDLGPDGGDKGGEIIAKGTPEELVKTKIGYTAKYLKSILEKSKFE